jgi:hypothetical protein
MATITRTSIYCNRPLSFTDGCVCRKVTLYKNKTHLQVKPSRYVLGLHCFTIRLSIYVSYVYSQYFNTV